MSIERAPETPEAHRSLLGAALNLEYGPCSVAAAELSRVAVNSMKHAADNILAIGALEERVVVSGMTVPISQLCAATQIAYRRGYIDRYSRQQVETTNMPFMLVQNFKNEEPEVRIVEVKKGRLKRKTKEPAIFTKKVPGDIWLADMVAGGRVLMPVAAFEPRIDGSCSYVQVGQEITDDSVFAVQDDEQTQRLELIESLRKLIRKDNGKPEVSAAISEFVHSERLRNSEQLTTALGAWLAIYFGSSLSDTNSVFHQIDVVPDGDPQHVNNIKTKGLPGRSVVNYDDNTYSVALKISQPVTEHGENVPITLSAVTRNNVAFPIIEFFPKTKEVCFVDANDMSYADKYKSLMAIITLTDTSIEEEFKQLIGSKIGPAVFLLRTHKIPEKIQERLSPECSKQERLVQLLGERVLNYVYTGTVHDVAMVTTRGSVRGEMVVEQVGDNYQAKISAVPDALAGMPLSEIISFVYDPAGKLGNQLPSGEDAAEFTRLINGFNNPRLTGK